MAVLSSKLILELVDRVTAPARDVQRSVAELNGRIEANNKRIAEVRGQALSAAAGVAAFAAALWKPITAGADFETMLEDIGQKAGIARDHLGEVGDRIREIGKATAQGATEVGKSVDFLMGMGATEEQALAAAEPIGKAATAYRAATEDLAAASFAVIDNLKVPAEQTARALDIMAAAGKEGGFELKDMAAEFPAITAAAQALGIEGTKGVADLTAALEVARKGAGSGSEAATNLQNFLSKITSKETIKNFQKLGVSVTDELEEAAGAGESAIEHMLGVIDRVTNGGRTDLINKLFGDMQVQQFLRPMLANMEEYRRIRETALDATGTVEADFARRMETFGGSLSRFRSGLEDLSIVVGTVLLPRLTEMMDRITPVIDAISEWTAANPRLVSGIIAATGALLGFRLAVAGLRLAGLMAMGSYLKTVASGFAPIARASEALRKASQAAALANAINPGTVTVWSRMGEALRGIAGVTGLTAIAGGISAAVGAVAAISAPVWVGIAAAVAAVGAAWHYWDRIEAIASGVARAIGEELQPILEALEPILGPIISGLNRFSDAMHDAVGWIGGLFDWVGEREILTADQEKDAADRAYRIAQDVIKAISILGGPFTQAGRDAIQALLDGMKEKFLSLIKWVRTIPESISNALPGWVRAIPGLFGSGDEEPEQAKAAGGWISPGGVRVGEHGEERLYASQAGFIAHHRAVQQMAALSGRMAIPQPQALPVASGGRAGGGPVNVTFGDIVIQGGAGASADELRRAFGREATAALRARFSDTF